MKKLERICPQCHKTMIYKSHQSLYSANRNKATCKQCWAKNMKGSGNPFYGKTHTKEARIKISQMDRDYMHSKSFGESVSQGVLKSPKRATYSSYDIWLKKYGKEEADIRLKKWKEKTSISSSGKNNPMYGKPAPQGSGNGWSGWYKNWYFRSLQELSYMIKVIEKNNYKWISAETKEYRIPYIDPLGKERTYTADFIINNSTMIECKPKKLWKSSCVLSKIKAAIQFCKKKNLKYRLVDTLILDYNKIRELVEKGLLIWLPRYKIKYEVMYKNRTDKDINC